MSIKTKIAALAIAALAATGSIATTTTAAEAHGFPHGFHHGFGFGGGLLGAAIVGSEMGCGWVRQYDAYGHYVGSVNTCY